MKKFAVLASAIAALGFVSAAKAADMPVKAPIVAPVTNWSGLYLGINAGYAWGTTNHTDNFGATSGSFNTSGGVLGVTYGYNWQFGRYVIGFEGDFDYANINGSLNAGVPCSVNLGTTCFTNMKDFGTDRVRLGYDVNGWLLYGTAGIGYGEVNAGQSPCGFVTVRAVPGGFVGGGFSCGDKWRIGWVAGVGVEKMFAPNWSAKLEYLHYDLGSKVVYNPTNVPAGSAFVSVLERGDMVRAGVNYHFKAW